MRIAIAGKGGAGKTTISATWARLAARQGTAVVAIDADANPNLSTAMGVAIPDGRVSTVPSSLVSRKQGGPGLTEPIDTVLALHSHPGPDGLALIGLGAPGHAEEGCLCAAHAVVAALLADLGDDPDRLVIVDMEASPEHLSRGTIRHVDVVVLIAEPYYRSLETVRRMAALVAELPVGRLVVMANKVRSEQDEQAIAEFCDRHGFDQVGSVPWSEHVGAADRARTPVAEWPGAEPVTDAVAAVAALFA